MAKDQTIAKFFDKPGGTKKGAGAEKQPGIKDMFKKASSNGATKGDKGEGSSSSSAAKAKAAEPEKPKEKAVEKEDEHMKEVETEKEKEDVEMQPITVEDSEEEEEEAVNTSRKKRRIVDDSDLDSDADQQPKKRATESKPSPAAAAAKGKEVAKPKPAAAKKKVEPVKKAEPAASKKASSSKPAAAAPKISAKAGSSKKAAAAAKDEEDVDDDEDSAESEVEQDEEDSESDDERNEAEEGKANKKLAAIFQKSDASSSEDKVKWKEGDAVPYGALAAAFVEIEATTKRLLILEILTKLFVRVIERSPDNLLRVIYLCINRLCPDYEGLELGIGEGLLLKAIAQGTGRDMKAVKKDLEAKGDLGLVAISSRQKQPTMFKAAALTVPAVFKQLKEIAAMTGNKSQDRKIGGIKKLLAASTDDEPKFIMRSLEGKLRIGLAERSVLVALAQSIVLTRAAKGKKKLSPEAMTEELTRGVTTLKAVFSEMPNYDMVVPALLEGGVDGCREKCGLTPGIPLKPMLAKPTKAITEVLDRFEDKAFTCEYKYDGERAQVHYFIPGEHGAKTDATVAAADGAASEKPQLAVFSRNSENMSLKYPDLVEQVPRCIKPGVKSFVFDAEVTAWKKEETDEAGIVHAAHLLPFQELSRRKRKDVKTEDIVVKVKLFAFDLLYLNGEPLLNMDLAARRKLLRDSFVAVPDEFDFATSQDCTTVEEIQTFLDVSVKVGCEGLMVKMLEGADATYEPSRRSMNWLKLKKDYLAGTGDSLDLVVIGGYYGKGKRTNVYGAFLLACYDADSESYQSVCKIGTGFSEADLEAHFNTLKPLELQSKKGYYDVGDAKPDVYFESRVVWEVLTADLSLSPVYAAAKGLCDKRGISLRFPRFIRIRDDKDPDDSTSPEQIAEMYRNQATTSKGAKKKGGDEGDDFW